MSNFTKLSGSWAAQSQHRLKKNILYFCNLLIILVLLLIWWVDGCQLSLYEGARLHDFQVSKHVVGHFKTMTQPKGPKTNNLYKIFLGQSGLTDPLTEMAIFSSTKSFSLVLTRDPVTPCLVLFIRLP